MALADIGDAFDSTSVVGGIVLEPRYPLRVWLKKLGSPFSVDDGIFGRLSPPWRHHRGKTTPHASFTELVIYAVQSGVQELVLRGLLGLSFLR